MGHRAKMSDYVPIKIKDSDFLDDNLKEIIQSREKNRAGYIANLFIKKYAMSSLMIFLAAFIFACAIIINVNSNCVNREDMAKVSESTVRRMFGKHYVFTTTQPTTETILVDAFQTTTTVFW